MGTRDAWECHLLVCPSERERENESCYWVRGSGIFFCVSDLHSPHPGAKYKKSATAKINVHPVDVKDGPINYPHYHETQVSGRQTQNMKKKNSSPLACLRMCRLFR